MSAPELERSGVWSSLFAHAIELMSHLEDRVPGAHWTFGGGTVLMLRIAHRKSKDIDLFVDDPQCLGFVNPRLSDVAERITGDYEEAAEFIKLFLAQGEIDIVVGPSLTEKPYDLVVYRGRQIKVETSAEIIAKKMWHRGHRAKARDLFDLCAVAEAEPEQIRIAAPLFLRHGAAFLQALVVRKDLLEREFAQIDVIGSGRDFVECVRLAESIIRPLLGTKKARRRFPADRDQWSLSSPGRCAQHPIGADGQCDAAPPEGEAAPTDQYCGHSSVLPPKMIG